MDFITNIRMYSANLHSASEHTGYINGHSTGTGHEHANPHSYGHLNGHND